MMVCLLVPNSRGIDEIVDCPTLRSCLQDRVGCRVGQCNPSVHVGAVGPVADLDAFLLAPGPCDDHLEVVVGNGGLECPEEPLRGPQREDLPLDVDGRLGSVHPRAPAP